MPLISIIIPTFNRRSRLQRVLTGVARQSVPATEFEVIVISDGATDGTDSFLEHYDPEFPFLFVRQENHGPSVARNTGVDRARSDLVLFLDDDVVPDERLVEEHLRMHREAAGEVSVIGPMLSPHDHVFSVWADWEDSKLRSLYRALEAGTASVGARDFYTGNASLPRRSVLEAGGFDPAFRRGEDVELAYRLEATGLKFVFAPRARGRHYVERPYPAWIRVADAYGGVDVAISERESMRWLRESLLEEFGHRHVLVRVLVRACTGRPRLAGPIGAALRLAAEGTWRLGWRGPARAACSALFNLRYYAAMSRAMGGRDAFLDAVAAAASSTS